MTALFSAGFAAAGVWIAYQLYASCAGPTAQCVAMGMGLVVIVVGAAAGALLGRAVGAARARGSRARALVLAALGAVLAAAVCRRAYVGRLHADELARIRTQPLTAEQARGLMSGSPEEVRALAYNKNCPPGLLTELAKSADYGVRANVAANPSTPPAVVDALAKDENEDVRYYVRFNPARRK